MHLSVLIIIKYLYNNIFTRYKISQLIKKNNIKNKLKSIHL